MAEYESFLGSFFISAVRILSTALVFVIFSNITSHNVWVHFDHRSSDHCVRLLTEVQLERRGIWREHSSKKWLRPRFSVDLIKGLQMSREKPKLTQIFHLSSGVPLTFFLGTIFVGIVGRRR
jgi:hypothetical protein